MPEEAVRDLDAPGPRPRPPPVGVVGGRASDVVVTREVPG